MIHLVMVFNIIFLMMSGQVNAELIGQKHQKSQASDFGRLFSSSNQRQSLDYLRKTQKEMISKAPIQPQSNAEFFTPYPVELPDKVAVQGFVKRSDGVKSTVWVNGEPMQEITSNQDLVIGKLPKQGNRVPIKVKANGKYIGIKAGQAYNPETNRIKEMHAPLN